MVRGIAASGGGMVAQSQKIDVLANNIANIDTPGYKKDNVSVESFQDQLLYNLNTGARVGATVYGAQTVGTAADFSEGDLSETGLSTDFAVLSGGFFAVQGGAGTEYTRNGSFTVDDGGYLALSTGQRLLGQDGRPLRVGGTDFIVAQDGTVTNAGGTVGKIALYTAAGGAPTKNADGLFTLQNPVQTAGTLRQGWLEGSNVDVTDQMTGLMSASRAFQSCQQAFEVSNESEQLLVNQVGSLK